MLNPFIGSNSVYDMGCYDPTGMVRRQNEMVPSMEWMRMNQDPQMANFNKNMNAILSADLIDKGTEYEIHCDIPGVDKEDLDITITKDFLTIRGERKQVHENNSELVHRIERTYGKVQRSIRMPTNADSTKAVAKFERGVLVVTFPKLVVGLENGPAKLKIT